MAKRNPSAAWNTVDEVLNPTGILDPKQVTEFLDELNDSEVDALNNASESERQNLANIVKEAGYCNDTINKVRSALQAITGA